MADIKIMHPRPSAIVAALYTLRDLDADVAILHGPPGCSFKHARLLEEDDLRVVTTAMDETDFVFGGRELLTALLEKVTELWHPKRIGVVGTCASMIIGEDLHQAVADANLDVPVIVVEMHAGYHENTHGVIVTLESARDVGIIDDHEFERQKALLKEATLLEQRHGAASKEYLEPSRGDLKYRVSEQIIKLLEDGKDCINIMNAKKETAYMFSDILLAINECAAHIGSDSRIVNLANLRTDVGLPRVQQYAVDILRDLDKSGVQIHETTGGLDEYPITGNITGNIIESKYSDFDFAVISGVPHAVPMESMQGMEVLSVTNGPRQVLPLKEMGHTAVVVEIDLHPKTLGVNHIVESEFGATLREMCGVAREK
ncbi:MAG: Ni-sirohydrochlorin a,c-diamide reductive cyclase catalytic subunit [Euryarchaeota archaeon]|nr:MAG: Ni-sirohydrochlorin a,c-diamide reductive cyclase catalytic subunit [ANME-2 cluster archaeon]MEA1864069.1 Ni-sirohydrochlorin a,c-diamide reductive cyclase catalytic subunit [Euryarchaeota archaeon]